MTPPRASRTRRPAGSATGLALACALAVLVGGLGGACSSRGAAPVTPAPAGASATADAAVPETDRRRSAGELVPHLAERALLLLLVDRQSYDGFVVQRALGGPPELRRELAVALGRMDDPRGVRPLAGLLLDDSAPVRRAAAFALGELAEDDAPDVRRDARAPLMAAVTDPDRETGRLAVEALAKAGVPVLEVGARLLDLDEEGLTPEEAQRERWARLLPSLWRFTTLDDPLAVADAVSLAESALAADDPDLHRWAAYALARNPVPDSLPALRDLLTDPEPRIRAWAARGIGVLAGASGEEVEIDRRDLELLEPLVAPATSAGLEPGAAIQALGAARQVIDTGRAAAPASWVPTLLALFEHPQPGVRVAALDASAAWLGEPELSAALAARVTAEDEGQDVSTWERSRALLALAAGEDPRAEELALRLAQDDDPVLRAAAATAAAELGTSGRALAEILFEDDPSPRVRQAAAETLRAIALAIASASDRPADELAAVVAPFLADQDSGVRTGALGFLEDHPVVAIDLLERSALSSLQSDGLEERLAAVAAVAARAQAEPGERDALMRVLETLVTEGELPTRRAAARALEELGGERIAVGAVATSRGVDVYQRMLLEAARPRLVRVETDRGAVTLRLHCSDAPLTCLNFLQLAEGGFYDDLVFHRVVPDFVVQAGDPRGDGWGGPGYQIRDEIGRLRYDRGVLGMALAGPDTGGSQWFITLAPQPHLDGGYTAFGEAVAGGDVLDRLHQGDTIMSVREVTSGDR